MMQLSVIMREADVSTKDFLKASQIPVKLYDRKDRLVEDEVHFVEPLFAHNNDSKLAFEKFLMTIEKIPLPEITVRIDEDVVAVLYKSVDVQRFSRRPALDPMDYMD